MKKTFLKYSFTLLFLFPPPFFEGSQGLTAQTKRIDSLLILLKTDKEDSGKVNRLLKLSDQYKKTGNNDTALLFGKQALELSQKIQFRKGITASLSIVGNIYANQGNYPEALKNYFSALKIYKETRMPDGQLGNKQGMAGPYNNIGNIYARLGNYPEALKNYLAALKIKETIRMPDGKIGDKQGIANSYNNIGNIYSAQSNDPEALKNYFAALKLQKEIRLPDGQVGNKQTIAASYSNIGIIYANQGNYAEALKNHLAGLKILEEIDPAGGQIGNKRDIAGTYNNIGKVYDYQKNYPEALKNYFAALKIREKIGDKRGIAVSNNSIGNTFISQKKPTDAKIYLLKSLALSTEIGNLGNIKVSHEYFSRLDSLEGNFKSALEHYKLFIVYRDSLLNEENTKKTVQSQMQYDFDKKSAADSIKNAEAKKFEEIKHQHEISKQKTFTYSGIGGFLVMIVVAGISFNAFRNKKKANIEIQRQKHLVEEKQKEILDSIRYAKRIQRSLLTSEKYIERVLTKLNKS